MQETEATDNDILPAEKSAGGGQTETLYLLVDLGILFNVGIAAGDIGLGLVVVVIGDEVLHHIMGEKLAGTRCRVARPVFCCGR